MLTIPYGFILLKRNPVDWLTGPALAEPSERDPIPRNTEPRSPEDQEYGHQLRLRQPWVPTPHSQIP